MPLINPSHSLQTCDSPDVLKNLIHQTEGRDKQTTGRRNTLEKNIESMEKEMWGIKTDKLKETQKLRGQYKYNNNKNKYRNTKYY